MSELSRISLLRLEGVHPDLVRVVKQAIHLEGPEFMVTEGVRSKNRQKVLFAAGATRTMNSRHLTGHTVDLAVLLQGVARWDWPLYHTLSARMKAAAAAESVPITWGGDWTTFPDGPHFELPWAQYPA